jgi:hypothetical protein
VAQGLGGHQNGTGGAFGLTDKLSHLPLSPSLIQPLSQNSRPSMLIWPL